MKTSFSLFVKSSLFSLIIVTSTIFVAMEKDEPQQPAQEKPTTYFFIKTNDNIIYAVPVESSSTPAQIGNVIFLGIDFTLLAHYSKFFASYQDRSFFEQHTKQKPVFLPNISSTQLDLVVQSLAFINSPHWLNAYYNSLNLDNINLLIRAGEDLEIADIFPYIVSQLLTRLKTPAEVQAWGEREDNEDLARYLCAGTLFAAAIKNYFNKTTFERIVHMKTYDGDDPEQLQNVIHIAFDPTDSTSSTCVLTTKKQVTFWENFTTDPKKIVTVKTKFRQVLDIMWHPDGAYIAVESTFKGKKGPFITFFNRRGKMILLYDKMWEIGGASLIGYSSEKNLILFKDSSIQMVTHEGELIKLPKSIDFIAAQFSYNPNSDCCAILDGYNGVDIYDINKRKKISKFEGSKKTADYHWSNKLAWNTDGSLLASSFFIEGYGDRLSTYKVTKYDIANNTSNILTHTWAQHIFFTNTNDLIILPTNQLSQTISLWSLDGVQKISTPIHSALIAAAAIDPSRQYVAITYTDNTLELWKIPQSLPIDPDIQEFFEKCIKKKPFQKEEEQ
jgi:WD40 repeat protein